MLKFIFGTMGSAKTANALIQNFELISQGKKVVLMKPAIDSRDGVEIVKSRIGICASAHIFSKADNLTKLPFTKMSYIDVIIIDEAQFCTEAQINQLKILSIKYNIKIYCYGLKTDFTSHFFTGSKRLMEIADETQKLDMTCLICGKPAEINARMDESGKITVVGEQIVLGANDTYKSLCFECWARQLHMSRKSK